MSRLSRAGIAVVLLAGVLWAGGVAEANHLPSSVVVCVDASSGVVSRMTSDSKCVGATQFWSASKPAPLLCWNPSLLARLGKTRVVSIAPSSGCAKQLRSVPANTMSLVCANGETGVLRVPLTGQCAVGNKQTWVRPTSKPNVATTTTLISSTNSTTTATTAVVVPSVSLNATWIQSNTFPKAVTVTANVAGTIYLAEGAFVVKTVSDITSAPSYRWSRGTVTSANTPTSIAIDVDALTNGYYRVFVANSQGVLSAPATNIVTISVPRTPTAAEIAAGTTTTVAATTTTVALTCATGGSCAVGETGPGGGVVFYAAVGTFASPGSPCNTAGVGGISTCKFLEAAPAGWIVSPASQANCITAGTSTVDPRCEWAGDISTLVGTSAQGTAIGTGYGNTTAIIAQPFGGSTAGRAATTTQAYQGGGKTDWFLPSKDELNELCKYAKNTGQAAGGGTRCAGGSAPSGRGYSNWFYWSSSEVASDRAWSQYFQDGMQDSLIFGFKGNSWSVRPVRAF